MREMYQLPVSLFILKKKCTSKTFTKPSFFPGHQIVPTRSVQWWNESSIQGSSSGLPLPQDQTGRHWWVLQPQLPANSKEGKAPPPLLLMSHAHTKKLLLQVLPESAGGWSSSTPIIAWVENKMLEVLRGDWKMREFSEYDKSAFPKVLEELKARASLPSAKSLVYNNVTGKSQINMPP